VAYLMKGKEFRIGTPTIKNWNSYNILHMEGVGVKQPAHVSESCCISSRGLGKYNVGALTLSAGRKYCQASGGVMLKNASTVCKCPQVRLFCKVKSNVKD